MAYMTPQQYLDALTGIGQGNRLTVFEDRNEGDPNNILKFAEAYQGRTGAPGNPDWSGARDASGTYSGRAGLSGRAAAKGLVETLSPLQQGLGEAGEAVRSFGQQQRQSASPNEGPSGGMTLPMGPDGLSGGTDEPRGMMSKIGDFFTRTPGMGQTLSALGAGMAAESSKPGGSFWAGLASGSDAAMEAEQRRQVIEQQQQAVERNRRQGDEDRAIQKAAREKVREVVDGLGPDATPEETARVLLMGAVEAAKNGNSALANAFVNTSSAISPDAPGSQFTPWSGATPGYAVQAGPGDEWVPAAADQSGVKGVWEKRNNILTGAVEQRFAATGAEPQEAVGRDVDVGKSTAAVAIEGIARLKDFTMDMAGLSRKTGEPVKGIASLVGLLASTMDQNIGQSDSNWFIRALRAETKKRFNESDIPMVENIISGQVAALAVVNPMVRWLSGAQMTNQETSRYYKSLIPSWGDNLNQVRIKMLGMETLALAMSGDLEAIERLGGLGREIEPRLIGEGGGWLESEEAYGRRLQAYGEGQAANIYNRMEDYAEERQARIIAAGPQFE